MVQNKDNIDSEVILLLLKSENHLRGIAKQLNESHSTVLRKLNKLVKENVLDYKREGKNKVFFIRRNLQAKNYVFNAERYKLIKLLKKYPELNVIMDALLKKCNERLIVLFGSYAKFTADKDSDIDVYVETKSRKVKEELESINSKIKIKIGSFDLESNLVKEIIKNHIILKGVEEFYEKPSFLSKLKAEGKLKLVELSEEICNSYIGKADNCLKSARILLQNNLYENSVSMSYYAMYNSLRALLFIY